ncbi:MAG: metallophosphoesterase [Halieaceae bacterium]|nr:metallophosphoesterase [Halieaceae bacterium]
MKQTSQKKPAFGLSLTITPLMVFAMALQSCAPPATDDQPQSPGIGVLIFGDSGYHLNYPDEDDYDDLFNDADYRQNEWKKWLEDKRPEEEFEARPSAVSPITGGTVPATGIHRVAAAMRRFCAEAATCDFGLMLGDNIYPSGATLGADGFDDAQRFEDMLSGPFGKLVTTPESYTTYVTLGNHDWETSREGGFAQIEYLQKAGGFYIDGPYYSVKPAAGNGEIELFIIDTSMILAATTVREDYLNDDGSEMITDEIAEPDYAVEPMTDAERAQPGWLEAALKASTAKWKFVVAHHPIWSSSGSKFEQARVLRELILPAMCRYADAYLAGHDHTLEIHTDSCAAVLGEASALPLVQIVSGAASKQRPVNTAFMRHQERNYPEHKTVMAEGLLWGFSHLTLQGDSAEVRMMTVPEDGGSEVTVSYVYQFKRRSHLH